VSRAYIMQRKQYIAQLARHPLLPDWRPPNWESYSLAQMQSWARAQIRKTQRLRQAYELVQKRAAAEKFELTAIEVHDEPIPEVCATKVYADGDVLELDDRGDPDPSDPAEPGRYVIHAYYGPLRNNPRCAIITMRYRRRYDPTLTPHERGLERGQVGARIYEEDVLYQEMDHFGGFAGSDPLENAWGPKQFLHKLFSEVGRRAGNVIIKLTHNGQVLEIDPTRFRELARRADAEPAVAVMDPGQLLGMDSRISLPRKP